MGLRARVNSVMKLRSSSGDSPSWGIGVAVLAKRPCLRALREAWILPRADLGPVDLAALERLA